MNMHDKLYCKYELFLKILQDSYKILPIVKFVDKIILCFNFLFCVYSSFYRMRRKCTYGISHPHSFVVIGRAETDCLEKLWSTTSVCLESFIHPKGSRRDCFKFFVNGD